VTNATCNCGVAYQPKSVRAAEYAQQHPTASVREIAEKTDVSIGTAHAAKAGVQETEHVDTTTGRDGKSYSSKHKVKTPEEKAVAALQKQAKTSGHRVRRMGPSNFIIKTGTGIQVDRANDLDELAEKLKALGPKQEEKAPPTEPAPGDDSPDDTAVVEAIEAIPEPPPPEGVQSAVTIAREIKQNTKAVTRLARTGNLSDQDLEWLAVEALEVSRAWDALSNELLARTTDGKERLDKLKERAAANGFKLQKVGIDRYRLAPISEDDGPGSVMSLDMVPEQLDLAEGKLYVQRRTMCGMTAPFEESNKQIRDQALAKNPDAKPYWLAH
jgi:hypothetical protein